MGGEDGDGPVIGVQGSFPAGAGVDIVEVCCAISVCLRPFAAEGRSEAVEPVSKRTCIPCVPGILPSCGVLAQLHLASPPSTSILHLRRMIQDDQIRIEYCVLVRVQNHPANALELPLPLLQS